MGRERQRGGGGRAGDRAAAGQPQAGCSAWWDPHAQPMLTLPPAPCAAPPHLQPGRPPVVTSQGPQEVQSGDRVFYLNAQQLEPAQRDPENYRLQVRRWLLAAGAATACPLSAAAAGRGAAGRGQRGAGALAQARDPFAAGATPCRVAAARGPRCASCCG